jgi:dienelactone hydrolase
MTKHHLPLVAFAFAASLFADTPLTDPRRGPLKDLDGYFPFSVPATRAAWDQRADEVRKRVLVSQGLFPLPTRTPLNAVVHGRIERDDYTVEKVFFEAMPGFFVTGNLYRPHGKSGPFPAVLCAHGHWADARFAIRGDAEIKKELESGGEKLPESGRSIFQSLCVQLARMGCVAFMYDMIGNSDSQQLSMALAHGFKKQRPEANSPDGWGFFSAQAELRCQSIMGLQSWSSIRALDFVSSLADVDAKRIAMTGASGGGTQTFIASAIDPRIAVSIPCVMVSTAMQGGCSCENASLLRVGTGNIEFAALFAPKPLAMTAADDWTKEMETKGFPELKQLFTLAGAPDKVALWPMLHFGHNYNAPTREHIYSWLNQHFALGLSEPIVERDYPMLQRDQLTVWDGAHPAPQETGLDLEMRLLHWWHQDGQKQLTEKPAVAREAWRVLIGRGVEPGAKVLRDGGEPGRVGKYTIAVPTAQNARGERVPFMQLSTAEAKDRVVLWLSDGGAPGALFGGKPIDTLRPALDADVQVVAPNLFGQGSFKPGDEQINEQRVVKNPREAPCYTLGYNDALFAQRVHDVLTVIAALRSEKADAKIHLVANGKTAPIGAAAALIAGDAIASAAIDTSDDHPFSKITEWRDPGLLPGAVKYGDLAALIRLNTARPPGVFKSDAERAAAIDSALKK